MRRSWGGWFLIAIHLFVAPLLWAQNTGSSPDQTSQNGGLVDKWLKMAARSQAEQPHWAPAVVTTPARLLQVYRYDIFWQTANNGFTTVNYDGNKGIEFIPQRHVEIFLVAPPPYIAHQNPALKDGFGDWSFLVKYRIAAANEQHGNYILTAFLQTTLPTGQYKNGALKAILTPTIAYGKGFRRFDVQGTFGAALPTSDEAKIGRTFIWNDAFQYHVSKKLWPDVEANYAHFQDGPNHGKTQVFITPGIVFGNLHLAKRVSLAFGGGFQIAATDFHVNNHNGIFTIRFPF